MRWTFERPEGHGDLSMLDPLTFVVALTALIASVSWIAWHPLRLWERQRLSARRAFGFAVVAYTTGMWGVFSGIIWFAGERDPVVYLGIVVMVGVMGCLAAVYVVSWTDRVRWDGRLRRELRQR